MVVAAPVKPPYVPRYGANVGVYLPSSRAVRDLFGSQWRSAGIGLGSVFGEPRVVPRFDFSIHQNRGQDARATLLSGGVGVRKAFGSNVRPRPDGTARLVDVAPFWTAGVGITYADIRFPGWDVRKSWATTAYAGLGVGLGSRGLLEVRYRTFSRIQSLNFSGFSLTAGIRF